MASTRAGRVQLNVGGTCMTTALTTLEARSSYFRSMFSRWSTADAEDEIFLDCDADAFRVLLSYMRSGVILLPKTDADLCSRVLLQAEFLGMDELLWEVKGVALKHTQRGGHSRTTGGELAAEESSPADRAAAFDAAFGSLHAALISGVLPDRYWGPPTAPALRTIKQLLPATDFDVAFGDGQFSEEELYKPYERSGECQPAVCLALVEQPDGTTVVDALCQPSFWESDPATRSMLQLASDVARDGPWDHWVLRPQLRMVPLPKSAVGNIAGVGGDSERVEGTQEFLSVPFACMAKDGHGPMRFYGATGGRDGEEVRLRNVSTSIDFHKHLFNSLSLSSNPVNLNQAAKPADTNGPAAASAPPT